MKILLIKPYLYLHGYQNLELPLGIMAISAYLKRELRNAVSISLLDLRVEKNHEKVLFDTLSRERPDIIGISLMNCEKPFLQRYLGDIRAALPHALIVAGGAYPTCDTEGLLREFSAIDLVVRGEGEETFLAVVRCCLAGEDHRSVPGTAYREGEEITIAPPREFIEPLDRLPMPDYEAVDLERYFVSRIPMNAVNVHRRCLILMTSRGCPYRCAFCHDIMGKQFRPHSPRRVLDEICFLHDRYGVREIHFVDDVFNLDRERTHRILRGIAASGRRLYFAFPNGLRSDLLTEEDIDLMKRAGVYHLLFPLETATPRLQELVEKRLDLDRCLRIVRYAHRSGIVTKACFMLGFPTETEDDLRRTLALAFDPSFDMMAVYKVAYFRHTELARKAREQWGDAIPEQAEYYAALSPYEQATGRSLGRLIAMTYLRFYGSWRILRLLWRLPRRREFLSRLLRHAALVWHTYAAAGRR